MNTIDVSKLEKLELDPTSFIYLYYRVQGITPIPDIIEKQANYELLDNLGYIKWINNKYNFSFYHSDVKGLSVKITGPE